MEPTPDRRPLLALIAVGAALASAGGFFALRPSTEPALPAEPSFDSLPLPELMDKVRWNLPPDEEEALARAFVSRGRPAADALLAALADPADDAGRSLPYLARLRRDSSDPALRGEVDQALRGVFPLKLRIVRTISDEEAQRQAALVGAQPGDLVEFSYDPMGTKVLGEEEVEVETLRGLVDLLAEENASALRTLTYAFSNEYIHRFGEEVEVELRRAAREVRTAEGAAMALARIQGARAAPFLIELLKDPEAALRAAGHRGFEALEADAPATIPLLLELMRTEAHRSAARNAVLSVSNYLTEDSARLVLGALATADAGTRISLMELLRRLPASEGLSLAPVEALLRDPDEAVADHARQTLDALRPRAPDEAD